MEERNRSDAIPLPRWESFQVESNEPGRDFPTGPYNRMITKLYGTGGDPLESIDIHTPHKISSGLGSANEQPALPVSEGMVAPIISSSVGQLMHRTRQEDELSRFGLAVAQHTEGSKQDDIMIAKLSGTGGKPLEYTGISRMANTSSRLGLLSDGQPMPLVSEGMMDMIPFRSFSGVQLMHKTRQEEGPSRLSPAVTQHTEGSKQGNEPVRFGPADPKHLVEKGKLDIGLVHSGTGDDHPADKVPATVASAGGQTKGLANKVKLNGAPAGVIFLCNNQTKKICFQYGLFGLPGTQLNLVQRIVPGTLLFLFVMGPRELHGIFEASSNGGFNLEPKAFGASFPSQVRFKVSRQCRPLMESVFRKAIEDNYYNHTKINSELNGQQVANLLQLFCPEGVLDEKEQKHENLMPSHSHAHGKKDLPVSDPAESQSELSMEISSQDPQSSPAVDSHQSKNSMLIMESHMGAHPSVMGASKDYNTSLKDLPAVSGQGPVGDRMRMQGLRSIPIEGSRHYYSPSVDGPMLSKSTYMDVMGVSQKSLTEETRLVQPSLDRFQRGSTSFSRESAEILQPMADVNSHALGKTHIEGGHDIYADERHYLSSSRVANGSYSLDATDNDRKSSLYGSGLQPHGSGAQCHILNEQAKEKGNFHIKDNLQDSMQQSYARNSSLQSYDGGVSGQRFTDADVERGKFLSHNYLEASNHHISRSHLWSQAEVTGNSIEQNRFSQLNPNERELYTNESEDLKQEQFERLAIIRQMSKQDQQRSQENINFNNSRDLPGGWVDASNFHSHKRVSEDPVDYASNLVKRRHYYNESHGDRIPDEQAHSVNGASLGGNWMGNVAMPRGQETTSINHKLNP